MKTTRRVFLRLALTGAALCCVPGAWAGDAATAGDGDGDVVHLTLAVPGMT